MCAFWLLSMAALENIIERDIKYGLIEDWRLLCFMNHEPMIIMCKHVACRVCVSNVQNALLTIFLNKIALQQINEKTDIIFFVFTHFIRVSEMYVNFMRIMDTRINAITAFIDSVIMFYLFSIFFYCSVWSFDCLVVCADSRYGFEHWNVSSLDNAIAFRFSFLYFFIVILSIPIRWM